MTAFKFAGSSLFAGINVRGSAAKVALIFFNLYPMAFVLADRDAGRCRSGNGTAEFRLNISSENLI